MQKNLHDSSTNDYSARDTCLLDLLGWISIPATVVIGPVFVNVVILYSLAYDAADVMDDDNLATTLSAQIQVSIVLIGMVKKPSAEPIVSSTMENYPCESSENYSNHNSKRD